MSNCVKDTLQFVSRCSKWRSSQAAATTARGTAIYILQSTRLTYAKKESKSRTRVADLSIMIGEKANYFIGS
jgi:hypothetical protein